MKDISNLSSISSNYDAVLLDLWGVVHDGTHLYSGAREAMTHLKEQGKTIILVSNAPRRVRKAAIVLEKLGVNDLLYDHIITSGELGYQWLEAEKSGWGKRYYYIGPSKDADVLDGLKYSRIDDIKECDFLLNVGFGSEGEIASDFTMLLRAARAQNIPMLCLNPDLEVVKISGERFECAGVIADAYLQMGGEVKYFGKPFRDVYEYCMGQLSGINKSRVLAVGDSIITDIAGAVGFGIDSMLVTGGILQKPRADIEELCAAHKAIPDYITPALNW